MYALLHSWHVSWLAANDVPSHTSDPSITLFPQEAADDAAEDATDEATDEEDANQPVVPPPSVEFPKPEAKNSGDFAVPLSRSEISVTLRKALVLVIPYVADVLLIMAADPPDDAFNANSDPALVPWSVSVPATVCVVPDVSVSVCPPPDVLLKFWKELEPLMVWLEPSNVTVPELCVKVPPVRAKLPDTVMVPDGAVNVPDESVKTPFTSTVPDDPVNVPPDTVSPPLKVCVSVDAVYVPPDTVARPVTVVVCAFAFNVPFVTVSNPATALAALLLKLSPLSVDAMRSV